MSVIEGHSRSPRLWVQHACPIACVVWRPTVHRRQSRNPGKIGVMVETEDLLVGDEMGHVLCYSVESPSEIEPDGFVGRMTLISRIAIHTQQICGLAWSANGTLFATGGNDNLCLLFSASTTFEVSVNSLRISDLPLIPLNPIFTAGAELQHWNHSAAVKAIAFCPWRDGLVATGGGSNDKCIHFFHTTSGACLATISVSAQVTSLIWSTSRREIAATFGYAQPEHPVRVAVFSWPECLQVAAIP